MIKGLVSVIVPVYNVEGYLAECLDSILVQTYSNIEIILIDDGSTDASGTICEKYALADKRIRVIHQKNGGVSKARNTGLSLIQGEYFSFVDGDDTIDASFIELMVHEMSENDVDLVRLSWYRGDVKKTYFAPFNSEGKYLVGLNNLNDLLWFANIWGLFRSECLQNIRFDEQLKYAEDNLFVFEFFLKSKKQRMLLIDKPFYHYRIVNSSATNIDYFDRLNRSKMFIEKMEQVDLDGINFEYLKNRYIYKDYLVLYYYFIDNNIKSQNGYDKNHLKEKIEILRKDGCREYTLAEKTVSIMYRYHLHFLLTLARKIRFAL